MGQDFALLSSRPGDGVVLALVVSLEPPALILLLALMPHFDCHVFSAGLHPCGVIIDGGAVSPHEPGRISFLPSPMRIPHGPLGTVWTTGS